MMQRFLVFSCLLAATAGFLLFPPLVPNVMSKRKADNETSATSANVYQLINETLQRATGGINAEDLKYDADSIIVLANAVLEKRGANVSQDEIRSLVNNIASQYYITLDPTIILDDAVTAEAKYIGIEFTFLQKLREQGLLREAAGESTDVIVAAIVEVSEALVRSVSRTEGIIKFLEATNQLTDNGGNGDNATTAENRREASLDENQRNKRKLYVGVSWGPFHAYGVFGRR